MLQILLQIYQTYSWAILREEEYLNNEVANEC